MSYRNYLKRTHLANKVIIRRLLFSSTLLVLIFALTAYLFLRFTILDSIIETMVLNALYFLGSIAVVFWLILILAYLWEVKGEIREH